MAKLALIVMLALFVGWLTLNHRRAEAAEHELGAIASEIAGRPARVHCQGAVGAVFDVSAEAGSVQFDAYGRPDDTTELKRGVCKALRRFERERTKPEFDCLRRVAACPPAVIRSAWAVQTLAHEAWHLAGIQAEARAQCFGMQTTAYVAERLGADGAQSQALAGYLYRHVYPRMPSDYRSSECRDGEALDLRPDTTVFP